MDREEGFPPHVVGFMKRKREKERPGDARPQTVAPGGQESSRTASGA
jgi:hypothetical protein